MRGIWQAALAAAALLWAGQAGAVQGTFVLADGSYSINVEEDGGNLVVVEPNKRSVYTPDGSGAYVFHNANTGSNFYLRVHDESTIEAGRVGTDSPWILKKVDVAGAMAALESNEEHVAIAERYAALAESDPDNAQAWSMCSAVAFKRAMDDGPQFAEYAQQTAQMLQLIMTSPANPCDDAIPARYW
ncbi:hypothetical protein [Luteimonas sp. MC1572]|uniref:hypothetical protein n=1 Tax=Luteimonas sp. MC1572 TaxID=2799325 RepID=UPI0018F0AD6A|nr:hypothetical protein [Luteimonas sp. MC1572]MBJ6980908.1 hypothetical protein [Luteimonas sp. MC1572]QQO02264.1 hypothetical protein JGR64_08545 [Luteimonas sp. MC1572]